MSDQLTLFNLIEFESVQFKPVNDPYWNEIELEPSAIFDKVLLCTDFLPHSAPQDASVGEQIFSQTTQTESLSEYPEDYSLSSNSESLLSEYPQDYSLSSNSESLLSEYPQDYSLSSERRGEGVNVYTPAGTAGKALKYFRCSCTEGKRIRHIHIPGGNTRSPLACQNAEIIRQAFACGKRSVAEIKAIVCSLPSAGRWGRTKPEKGYGRS